MDKQELEQWINENKLSNGKIRNQQVLKLLSQELRNKDSDNINIILDNIDKDFLSESESTIMSYSDIADYFLDSIKSSPESLKKTQEQSRELLAFIPLSVPEGEGFFEMQKEINLFSIIIGQLYNSPNEYNKTQVIDAFLDTFLDLSSIPESPNGSKLHNEISKEMVGRALLSGIDADELLQLKEKGFSLVSEEPSFINLSLLSHPNPSKEVIDLFIKEGNKIYIKDVIDSFDLKDKAILDTLAYNCININNADYHARSLDTVNSAVKNKNCDIEVIEILLKRGAIINTDNSINFNNLTLSAIKHGRSAKFIDNLLSSEIPNTKISHDMVYGFNLEKMTERGFDVKHISQLLDVFNKHKLLSDSFTEAETMRFISCVQDERLFSGYEKIYLNVLEYAMHLNEEKIGKKIDFGKIQNIEIISNFIEEQRNQNNTFLWNHPVMTVLIEEMEKHDLMAKVQDKKSQVQSKPRSNSNNTSKSSFMTRLKKAVKAFNEDVEPSNNKKM